MSIHRVDRAPGLAWLLPGPEPGEYGTDWAGRIHEWQPDRGGWVKVPPPQVRPQVTPRVRPEWEAEAG